MSSNATIICAKAINGLEAGTVFTVADVILGIQTVTGAEFSRRTVERTLNAMTESGRVRRVDTRRWLRTNPQPVAVQPELLKQQIATDNELLQSIARRLTNIETYLGRITHNERASA